MFLIMTCDLILLSTCRWHRCRRLLCLPVGPAHRCRRRRGLWWQVAQDKRLNSAHFWRGKRLTGATDDVVVVISPVVTIIARRRMTIDVIVVVIFFAVYDNWRRRSVWQHWWGVDVGGVCVGGMEEDVEAWVRGHQVQRRRLEWQPCWQISRGVICILILSIFSYSKKVATAALVALRFFLIF